MRWIGLVGIALLALPGSVSAEDGCEKFAWPLARERAWVAAQDKASVASGATLAALPKAAIASSLQPAGQVAFELPPERKPRLERWFGCVVLFPGFGRSVIFQVTMWDGA